MNPISWNTPHTLKEKLFIELMTSDRTLEAFREGPDSRIYGT
jgi:hypothetical protein